MKAVLNLDQNFFSMPGFHGNGMVVKDYNNTKNVKRKKWIEVDEVVNSFGFKKKRGNFAKRPESILYDLNKMDLSDKTLIHFGMHSHLYSYQGLNEFELYDKPQFYKDFNAFIYLFKHMGLKKMIWVVPDYYTSGEISDHFVESKFELFKKHYKMLFSDFHPEIYVTRYKDFNDLDKYDVVYFSTINNQPNLLNDDETVKIRGLISR